VVATGTFGEVVGHIIDDIVVPIALEGRGGARGGGGFTAGVAA